MLSVKHFTVTRVRNRYVGVALALLLLALAPVPVVWAQENSRSTAEQNKAMVLSGFDAWKKGTGSPFEFFADNMTWTVVGRSLASRTYHGRQDVMDNLLKPFNARLLGHLVPTVHNIYADGDTVIVYFDAAGTARDHQPYRNSYAWFLTFKDKKIVNATAFYDSIAFNDLWRRVQPAS
ncbi:nuclear transport factor 2 family protein [Sodalis sp. dw_96]|uniref:nuclear transport factor 2 family protein n=1 Tax=Sodalis sp. dw_96 TaxID=2719794 RepID=UPI001BD5D45B|nr:nuclear transport factor 2 family protein [Sodalis sp. dw_96]